LRYRYIKKHNNYDLTLNKIYNAFEYKPGWLMVNSDDKGNRVLYRVECFEEDKMMCDICNKVVEPLDAHMGRLNDKLIVAHIDCWNREIKK